MGTYSYFSFTETARQAFDLSEVLNSQEQNEAGCNGVHYVLRLSRVVRVFDTTNGSLDSIMARYGVAWSGQTASHCLAAGHEQHALTLDEMIDEKGMSDHWATKPEAFGTIITREQLAAEAGVEPALSELSAQTETVLPELKPPSPTELPPGPWTVEFQKFGGYDAISSGYWVKDATDKIIVVIDVLRYLPEDFDEDFRHAENPVARAMAERIAQIGEQP